MGGYNDQFLMHSKNAGDSYEMPGMKKSINFVFARSMAIGFIVNLSMMVLSGCGGASMSGKTGPGPGVPDGSGVAGFQAASTQQWVQQFGLGSIPNTQAPQNTLVGVAVDSQGNTIVGAYTDGAYPGFSDSSFSAEDVVAKFDPTGKQLWLQEIGTGQGDFLTGIAVDAGGDTYAIATTSGAFPGYSNPSGTQQGVIFKLDPNGKLLWLQQLSALSEGNPQSIAITSNGDVIVGFQSLSFSASGASPNGFLLTKLNGATGQSLKQQSYASNEYTLERLTVDGSGNILIIGNGGLPGYTNTNPSAPLVVKIDGSTGDILWGQSLASYLTSEGMILFGIATDSQGNVVIGGATATSTQTGISLSYDPAPSAQCILAKLASTTGSAMWVKQFGTGAGDQIYSVAVDASDNVLAAGTTLGVFASPYTQPQDLDFVVKFTPGGQDTWVQQFGNGLILNVSVNGGPQVVVDTLGNLLVGGGTQGAFSGFSNPKNAVEMFLAKFGP